MTSTPSLGKPPAAPAPEQRDLPTKMEAWYLAALKQWSAAKGRAPWLRELSGWLKKSRTAVYSALVSLENKGWVRRVGDDPKKKADRRFEAVQ